MAGMCPHPTAFYRREQEGVDSDKESERSEEQEVFDGNEDAELDQEQQMSDKKKDIFDDVVWILLLCLIVYLVSFDCFSNPWVGIACMLLVVLMIVYLARGLDVGEIERR